MTFNPSLNGKNEGKRGDNVAGSSSAASAEEYKVGPGHPPKEHRFPPGRSGNPKGRKPKKPSIELDLKLALEQALNKKITLKHGEIKNLDMPGMTMVFQVKDPAMLDAVKQGDKVQFKVERSGGALVITEMQVAK